MEETRGQRIKRLRQTLNWTQVELAERAELSQSYIARIEANQVINISPDELQRLVKALNTTREYLLMVDSRIEHLPLHLQEFVANPEAVEFIKKAYILFEYEKMQK